MSRYFSIVNVSLTVDLVLFVELSLNAVMVYQPFEFRVVIFNPRKGTCR